MTDDTKPTVSIDQAIENTWNTVTLGALTDELPEDYTRVTVKRELLEDMLDVAEMMGWDDVTFSLMSGYPVVIQNDQAADEPVLSVAPKIERDD